MHNRNNPNNYQIAIYNYRNIDTSISYDGGETNYSIVLPDNANKYNTFITYILH